MNAIVARSSQRPVVREVVPEFPKPVPNVLLLLPWLRLLFCCRVFNWLPDCCDELRDVLKLPLPVSVAMTLCKSSTTSCGSRFSTLIT